MLLEGNNTIEFRRKKLISFLVMHISENQFQEEYMEMIFLEISL